jgi:hypothetical protein
LSGSKVLILSVSYHCTLPILCTSTDSTGHAHITSYSPIKHVLEQLLRHIFSYIVRATIKVRKYKHALENKEFGS